MAAGDEVLTEGDRQFLSHLETEMDQANDESFLVSESDDVDVPALDINGPNTPGLSSPSFSRPEGCDANGRVTLYR